jgi:hypothetical protein
MRTRFLIAGTLTGGIALSLLGWFTSAILPPRYKQFRLVSHRPAPRNLAPKVGQDNITRVIRVTYYEPG